MSALAWLTVLAGAVLTGLLAGPVLRRLPEPVPDDDDPKIPYAALVGPRTAVAVGACALVALAVSAWRGDVGLWWAPATIGALSVVVDARTTYLPRLLAVATGLALAPGLVAHAVAHGPSTLAWAGVGALVGGSLMLAGWRWWGVGFGDVRLLATLGAAAAAQSPSLLYPVVLWGTVLGAVWGLASRARGYRGAFAYGPALWAGAFVALALT